jgi:hypothetical protein
MVEDTVQLGKLLEERFQGDFHVIQNDMVRTWDSLIDDSVARVCRRFRGGVTENFKIMPTMVGTHGVVERVRRFDVRGARILIRSKFNKSE